MTVVDEEGLSAGEDEGLSREVYGEKVKVEREDTKDLGSNFDSGEGRRIDVARPKRMEKRSGKVVVRYWKRV